MTSECKRSILSCLRCRKRKTRCDRQLPACSQCIAARANCTGISATDEAIMPRSIVQHLECEIARLETELVGHGQLEIVQASDILLRMPSSSTLSTTLAKPTATPTAHPSPTFTSTPTPASSCGPALGNDAPCATKAKNKKNTPEETLRASIISSGSLQTIVSATLPYRAGASDLLSRVRMGMTPSSAKIGENGGRSTSINLKTNMNTNLLEPTILRSIPSDIVQKLVKRYLSTIHRENPFLVASVVVEQLGSVAKKLNWPLEYSGQDPPSTVIQPGQQANVSPGPDYKDRGYRAPSFSHVAASQDFLTIYLILAISVTLGSANDGHEERCMALSMSLFEEGIQHLYGMSSVSSDIEWLQTILLVLLYATVCPRSANVWVLSGAALRTCLELGMHREAPHYMSLEPEIIQLRRRVFWAAYCMDRSICSALQLPLSTPDEAISTKLPWPCMEPFHSSIVYHKLISEILHVHFHGEPIPSGLPWNEWLSSIEERLRTWYRLSQEQQQQHSDQKRDGIPTSGTALPSSSSSLFIPDNLEFKLARGMMMLHRPSPRVPNPSPSSLCIAFESATSAERLHSQHIRQGFFRRPWLSAHYTREGATVVLFCLRFGYKTIAERFSATQIFDMTKLFTSNLLTVAANGWPEVSAYAGIYERLLGPLLERTFLRDSATASSQPFDSFHDQELMRLLYPGPAHLDSLRFGIRQRQEELSPFDFNLFMGDDDAWMADFPWDGHAGIPTGGPRGVVGEADAPDCDWNMELPVGVGFEMTL